MEIYAKSKFDYKTIKTLIRATSHRVLNPKIALIFVMICTIIIFALDIHMWLSYGMEVDDFMPIISIIICDGLMMFIHWGLPKMRYKALGKMQNLENQFVFGEDSFKVINKNEEINAEAEIKYSVIPKVLETPEYMFLYQDLNRVYVVDKSTITNGTIEDIRAKLAQYVPQKKYIIRRK